MISDWPPARPTLTHYLPSLAFQCQVHQSHHQSPLKERELLEFRNLAHGLVNTSKTVAYVVIVYHTSRGLKGPVPSHIKPWCSRKSDVRVLCQILKSALRFISLFERLVPTIQNFDPRDVLREMYSVIMDQNEYVNVVGRRASLQTHLDKLPNQCARHDDDCFNVLGRI